MRPLLALFLRSIRTETRSVLTYISRLATAVLLLGFLMTTHAMQRWAGAPGLMFIQFAVYLNLFVITFAGLAYFSSAIAEEKDEARLGLLRMTALNPLSILLGKSTSRLAGALLTLLVQLPFAFLAITMGGVMLGQVTGAYLSLGAYLFFLANLALIFSVICARTAAASFLTGVALLIFHTGPFVWSKLIWILGRLGILSAREPGVIAGPIIDGWQSALPLPHLMALFSPAGPGVSVADQVIADVLLGLGLFLVAWALFNRFAERGMEKAPARGPVSLPGSRRATFSPGRTWPKAIEWKDFNFVAGGKAAVLIKAIIVAIVAGFFAWLYFGTPPPAPSRIPIYFNYSPLASFQFLIRTSNPWLDFGMALTAVLTPLLWLDLAIAASRIFSIERKAEMLSSLATLPEPLWRLVLRKGGGCLLASWPLWVGILAGFSLTLPDLLQSNRINGTVMITFSGMTTVGNLVSGFTLLHVIAALSLHLRWGALPIGFVAYYVGHALLLIASVVFFQGLSMEVTVAADIVAMIFLQRWILYRLGVLIEES